jgi:citrate lyase subunit beta / citryl-CoA lyase
MTKIRRSLLLVPAGDARKIAKARATGADVLMLDLQDSIPFDDAAKRRAREVLREQLREPFAGQREVNVRVNALDSPWLAEDLELAVQARVGSVTFPELRTPEDLVRFEGLLRSVGAGGPLPDIVLDVETPAALCSLEAIALRATLVTGMVVGVNDYALEVHSSGALFGQSGEPSQDHLTWIRPKTIAVARAHGWTVADAVMLRDPKDLAAARAAMAQSKRIGFDGWVLLYPPQVGGANEVFAPSRAELAWAAEVLERHTREQAVPEAKRVATVPRQHLLLARYLSERSAAIGAPPPV